MSRFFFAAHGLSALMQSMNLSANRRLVEVDDTVSTATESARALREKRFDQGSPKKSPKNHHVVEAL